MGLVSLSAALALAQAPDVELVPVARGQMSGVTAAAQIVVRSNAEWEKLWKSHAAAQPLPAVDFTREMVAAVFLGSRPTGGFSVEIVDGRREGEALVLDYVERRPSPDAITTQALTSPFHIVRVEAQAGEVRFRRVAAPAPRR
jgi:hypothetical protein